MIEDDFKLILRYRRVREKTETIPHIHHNTPPHQHEAYGINQRVIVKCHRSYCINPKRLKNHIAYMTREGTGIEGGKPELFTINDLHPLPIAPVENEKYFFKFIVSPENGGDIVDLKQYAKDILYEAEKTLRKPLQWVACVHRNTEHPHIHIVIRGVSEGNPLIIPKSFIKKDFRDICCTRSTQELGPRSFRDIQLQKRKDLQAPRFTFVDRQIRDLADGNSVTPVTHSQKKRLAYLAGIELAVKAGRSYQLSQRWDEILKETSWKTDIIKRMHTVINEEKQHLFVYKETMRVSGKIIKKDIEDELKDKPCAVIQSDNRLFYVADYKLDRYREGDDITIDRGSFCKYREKGVTR